MITLKNLNKTYRIKKREIHALDNINLHIPRGKIFGILGKSGAGKSTLLRCVNLLERPTSGQVIVNAIDLTTLSPRQLKMQRRKIGMIFQHFNLLESRTVAENIALPFELIAEPKASIQEKVSALLGLVHLKEHHDHYPSQLSGGQKQRVAIARALATQPDILLCDEATSALDTHSTATILRLLKEINEALGVTILLITHELDVIKQICHYAAVLDHGQLIEQASVIDLFTHPSSAVTKQLVQKSLHIELPSVIKKQMQKEFAANKAFIVRFIFLGKDNDQPLIATLVRKFDITISIIQANIENIQDTMIGFTLCQLAGSTDAIQQALEYAQTQAVTTEVLGYV